MPVTKTAKRALRGSKNKEAVNRLIVSGLEIAIRTAKKSPLPEKIQKAVSLADRAVKKNVIHKNKAGRIKSQLSKLVKTDTKPTVKKTAKKASKK
jgi:small subunit ribosomal protein S20